MTWALLPAALVPRGLASVSLRLQAGSPQPAGGPRPVAWLSSAPLALLSLKPGLLETSYWELPGFATIPFVVRSYPSFCCASPAHGRDSAPGQCPLQGSLHLPAICPPCGASSLTTETLSVLFMFDYLLCLAHRKCPREDGTLNAGHSGHLPGLPQALCGEGSGAWRRDTQRGRTAMESGRSRQELRLEPSFEERWSREASGERLVLGSEG